jgi:signal transduction histidine kinase
MSFNRLSLSRLPVSGIVALTIIGVVAISLSIASYGYASYSAKRISDLATNEIKINSNIKAHDVSKIIENKLDKVTAVLRTLATAPAIHNAEFPRAYEIIAIRQDSTKEITDEYFWLDRDGKLLYSSKFGGNQSLYDRYIGKDLSTQEYFTEPKKSGTTFYSGIIETGEERIPKLYIAMPIIDTIQTASGHTEIVFNGVVVVGIKTTVLADSVKADLSVPFQSNAVIVDKKGTILYSTNMSNIGQNYNSYIYSVAAPESKGAIDSLLADFRASKSGSQEIKFGETLFTFSYSPVRVEGINFLMLYVYSAHTLTTEVNLLVDQQRTISVIIIAAIAAVAIGIGFLVISWNRRLTSAVEERTRELNEKSEQLLAHGKLQQEFINVAAHELRTPIQPLIGVIELIQDSFDGKDKVEITKEEIAMLARNAKRLERLSSDILEASRIESQTMKLNKEKVELNEKIQNVIRDFNTVIPNGKNLRIIFEPRESGLVYVEADRDRLFEVLSNLLRNATKFTDEGTIKIILETIEGNAVVRVRDTGRGIDSDIFPKLFTKFATKSDQGTGLGLYISRGIIEAHGGKIWAENNPDRRGSTFTFSLPLIMSEPEASHGNSKRDGTTL